MAEPKAMAVTASSDVVTDERMTELAWRMRVREATDLLAWFKREAYKDHTL